MKALLQLIGHTVLKILGWKIVGELPQLPKYIAILGIHTSNWDFFICLMARLKLRMPSHWFGKHTIFKPPFGTFFKLLGGVPIYRHKKANVVSQGIEEFEKRDGFIITLAPEGTRKRAEKWKTGFYHIAVGANVPILPIGLDYNKKELYLLDLFYPTGDIDKDLVELKAKFKGYKSKYPQFDVLNTPPKERAAYWIG